MKLTITSGFVWLVILMALDCAVGGFIGLWRNSYWSALNNKEFYDWCWLIVQFCIAAGISCVVTAKSSWLTTRVAILFRDRLTEKAFKLSTYTEIEGGPQRVQEDCFTYPLLMMQLISGLIRSVIMIIVFSVIILLHVSAWFLLFPVVYAAIGTVISAKIARPLTALNYINQVLEARFRQNMDQAFYPEVRENTVVLADKTKLLQYFQIFYNQITIIVPHLALAGIYFAGKITFGTFMQIAASFAELIGSLSFIINSFGDLNRLLSCRRRLKELTII